MNISLQAWFRAWAVAFVFALRAIAGDEDSTVDGDSTVQLIDSSINWNSLGDSTVNINNMDERREVSIDLLPFELWDRALDAFERVGGAVNRTAVAAVGVQNLDSSIVIVTLDGKGRPKKEVRRVGSPDLNNLYVSSSFRRIFLEIPQQTSTGASALKQNGRVYFMIHTTIKAAINYPEALSQAFPTIDSRIITGVAMLSIGTSLYGSYLFTKNMKLGYGKVAIMNCVGEVGLGVPRLAGLFLMARGAYDEGNQISAWGSMLGFPLSLWGGSLLKVVDVDEYGKAAVIRDFTRWAYFYGFVTPLLFDANYKDYLTASSALAIGFMPAGFFLGKFLTRQGMSSGRSVLLMVSGAMGAATGWLIPTWFLLEPPRPNSAGALAGHIGGTAIGFLMYPGKDYSFGQGVFIGASAAVGSAVALSVPLISRSNDDRHYTIAGVAGAWAGLFLGEWLSSAIFELGSRDTHASSKQLLERISLPLLAQAPLLALRAWREPKDEYRYEATLLEVAF